MGEGGAEGAVGGGGIVLCDRDGGRAKEARERDWSVGERRAGNLWRCECEGEGGAEGAVGGGGGSVLCNCEPGAGMILVPGRGRTGAVDGVDEDG